MSHYSEHSVSFIAILMISPGDVYNELLMPLKSIHQIKFQQINSKVAVKKH